jgi:hypothetical protein
LGNVSNFIALFLVALFVEFLKIRKLYFAIFAGIAGYAIADLTGMMVGLAVGLLIFFLDLKSSKVNKFFINLLSYLWKE